MFRALIIAAAVGLASGFALQPFVARPTVRAPAVTMMASITDVAAACLEEGCPIDMVEELIKELKDAASKNVAGDAVAAERKASYILAIKQLEALDPEADKSEIEKIVLGASRSFSVVDTFDFPGEPIGYTGKVGTTTFAGKVFEQ
jgi:hypothetical protein